MTNTPEHTETQDAELREARERAERAEARLAELEAKQEPAAGNDRSTEIEVTDGMAELRRDSMMAHLLDSLEAGKDIGHYGRLVVAMVARHFLEEEELLGLLTKDRDFSEEQAGLMLRQVEGRDYSPPRRERLLAWQKEQDFPILPKPEDPDCGNLYRTLKFPDRVYEHIGHYREEKAEAGE